MERILSKHSQREIDVLFYILGKKETTVREISQFFDVSIHLAKRTIVSINQRFESEFGKSNFINSNNFGVIKVNNVYHKQAFTDINIFKLAILKENVTFNLCTSLLTNPKVSRKDLISTLYISDIYLDKQIHKLREYLKIFNITIEVSSGSYNLAGSEYNIRIFSFIFLSQSFQNIEWPFNSLSLNQVKEALNQKKFEHISDKTDIQKYSLFYLYAIFENRIKSGNIINDYGSPEDEQILGGIFERLDISTFQEINMADIFNKPSVPSSELRHFLFLILISSPDIMSVYGKKVIGNYLVSLKGPYNDLAKKVLASKWKYKYTKIRRYDYIESFYTVTIALITVNMVKSSIKEFVRLLASDHLQYLDLEENQIEEFWEKNYIPGLNNNQEFLVKRVLYSFESVNKEVGINIFLEMTKDLTSSQNIKLRLYRLFNDKTIHIIENIDYADIIIADTFESSQDNSKVFYLDSVNNQTAWDHLQLFILKSYLQKEKEISIKD